MTPFRGKFAVPAAVLFTLATAGGWSLVEPLLGARVLPGLLLATVAGCGWHGGLRGAIAASVTAALAAGALHLGRSEGEPETSSDGAVRWLGFLFLCLLVGAVVSRLAATRTGGAGAPSGVGGRPEPLPRATVIAAAVVVLGLAGFLGFGLTALERAGREADGRRDAVATARVLELRLGAMRRALQDVSASGGVAGAREYAEESARAIADADRLANRADVPATEAVALAALVFRLREARDDAEKLLDRRMLPGVEAGAPIAGRAEADASHDRVQTELGTLIRRGEARLAADRAEQRRRGADLLTAVALLASAVLVLGATLWHRSRTVLARAQTAEAELARAAAEQDRRIADRTVELAESNDLLLRRETLLSTVTNAANVGLVVIDEEHRFRYANRAYALAVGRRPEDLAGCHVRDVRGGRYETEFRAYLERCFAGEVVAAEVALAAAADDGGSRHYTIVMTPDRDESRRVAVVVLVDVTEQRTAERSLRESRRSYATLVEQLPAAIFRKDLAGRYVFVNSAFAALAGTEPAKLIGRTSLEFAREQRAAAPGRHPPDWEASYAAGERHHAEIVATGRTLAQEEAYLAPDGAQIHCHSIKIPVRGEDGRIIGSQGVLIDVTETRRAEAALRAGEERIRLAAEAAAIGFWESDLRTGRITWSDRQAQLMGFAPGEFSGEAADFVALVHPDDRAKFRDARRRAIEGGGDYVAELRFIRRDGGVRWGLVRGRVERDESGAPVRFVGVEIDITAQKQAEQEVREQRRTLALFVEHVPAAITMLDRDLRYLSASRRWVRDFSADSPELIGRRHPELFAEFTEEWCRRYERALAGERVRVEAERWARAATDRWISWQLHPWRDDRGEIGGIVILAEDITARRTAELALQTERTLLRTIFDVLPESIYVKDRDSRFLMANAACAADMGAPNSAALLGRTDADRFDSGLAAKFREAELEVLGGREIRDRHDTFRRDDGTECHRINTVVPLRTPEGAVFGLLGTSRDVTAAKQAERQVRELNARLEQRVLERTAQLEAANKELEAFSYSVSHDLRAPLRAIDGFSRIVEEDHAALLPAEGRRRLATVRSEARRMGRLIDDLLAFSRLGRGPVEAGPVDMDALVRECVDSLAPDCAGREIGWEIGGLPPARGNAGLLRQVWFNLIANAVKYTRPRAKATIRISASTDAGGIAVYTVRDDGVGFDMRYAGRLFGVFQRLHRADEFEGTGAGLAIARRIVQRHFGRIWAEASPDQGASFHFTLFEIPAP